MRFEAIVRVRQGTRGSGISFAGVDQWSPRARLGGHRQSGEVGSRLNKGPGARRSPLKLHYCQTTIPCPSSRSRGGMAAGRSSYLSSAYVQNRLPPDCELMQIEEYELNLLGGARMRRRIQRTEILRRFFSLIIPSSVAENSLIYDCLHALMRCSRASFS